ncbi:MAG: hypothetical protein SGI83_05035 [Bacteroidota bacterium]|nr:hypothetical protein [Bacteroidota bacterium]
MKILLPAAAIVLLMASCNSNKSGKETEPIINKDTAVMLPDSAKGTTNDTAAAKPELCGIGDLSLELSAAKTIEITR